MKKTKRQELIKTLENLHQEHRAFQRLVNDEKLDYNVINQMPLDELEEAVTTLKDFYNNYNKRG